MRGTRAAALACLGAWAACSFKSPGPSAGGGNGDSTTPDAGPAEPDAPPLPPCASDATYQNDPTTGRRYKVLAQGANYDTAIDRCATDGAHLAVVDSAAENTFLAGILTTSGGGEAWIGFDDLTVEGMYKWVTGAAGVNLYGGGEPNNVNNEDCTALRTSGQWHDVGCEEQRRPACECDPSYRPPPTPACRTATTGFIERSGRRVFLGPAATWTDAKAACDAMGAHLLVISDVGENTEMDQSINGAHWIGYTDAVQDGAFVWVNGATSTYQRFNNGVPLDDNADCVVLQDGGAWDDIACSDPRPYACECDPLPP